MNVLEVKGLVKQYPNFALREVSFAVRKGIIMGVIGRNGAGKTTTLKSILNIVYADAGQVSYFGLDLNVHEAAIKQRIGFAGGAASYFKKRKIGDIMAVTKRFYPSWDDALYQKYMCLFGLDENKIPAELSQGMKVKLNLVMALSHGAELLILDEPTSGLDPISRDELLEIFKYLRDQGVSILFSTHITSDLDKCADEITYVGNGQIVFTGSLQDFTNGGSLEDVMLGYEKEALYEKFGV